MGEGLTNTSGPLGNCISGRSVGNASGIGKYEDPRQLCPRIPWKFLFHGSSYSSFFNATTTNSYNPKNAWEDLFRFLISVPTLAMARTVTCKSENSLNVLSLGFHVGHKTNTSITWV